jgi:glycosyltransferase involved in cell wall biosynthesis
MWVVSTEGLQAEAASYGTGLAPLHAPAVLPALGSLDRAMADRFLSQHQIDSNAPILHNPVRLTEVKGAHLALDAFSVICAEWTDKPAPVLLLWGPLLEDEDYSTGLVQQARSQGTFRHVRFLDGVPLATTADETSVRLDESDLLLLAKQSNGGVMFTPPVPDVETIGLGPALAGLAGLPCVVTPYNALQEVYGAHFAVVQATSCAKSHVEDAARRFVAYLGDDRYPAEHAERNQAIVDQVFDTKPWLDIWDAMRAAATVK